MWICVRSKDAQKQLARTSLIGRSPTVFSTLLSVFLLLFCRSVFRVSVVLLLRLCLTCFLPALWLKVSCRGFRRWCFLLTRCLLFCLSVIHCLVWILLSCVRLLVFFVSILNVCKFFIWRSRNDFRFRGVQPGAVSVIESVKARVKFNLPLFFKRFKSSRRRRYFHRQWGSRGILAAVVDGKLTFCL